MAGDVVTGVVIVHFTVRIVCDDGTSRRVSAAGPEGAGFNAEIGKIGVENSCIAVKSVNLEAAYFTADCF